MATRTVLYWQDSPRWVRVLFGGCVTTSSSSRSRRVFEANYRVYSYRKICRHLIREGFDAGALHGAGLMREVGLKGAVRGKAFKRTTVPDRTADIPQDPSVPNVSFVSSAAYSRPQERSAFRSAVTPVREREREPNGRGGGPAGATPIAQAAGERAGPELRAQSPDHPPCQMIIARSPLEDEQGLLEELVDDMRMKPA